MKKSETIKWNDNSTYDLIPDTQKTDSELKKGSITTTQWDIIKKLQSFSDTEDNDESLKTLIRIPPISERKKEYVFNLVNGKVYTTNYVGVLSTTSEEGTIRLELRSRFDTTDKQYFLLYLISTVYGFSLYNCDVKSFNDSTMGAILAVLFCNKIQEAYSNGLYKVYKTFRYNDFNFKGSLDVNRHIKQNTPFLGRTAYNTREYSYDNDLLCMIRQTFELIKNKYTGIWNNYCAAHTDLYEINNVIAEATLSYQPNISYHTREMCCKTITHPMYQCYDEVRKICRRLLQEEGDNIYDDRTEESFGLLINVAWLWEEFIADKLLDGNEYIHIVRGKNGTNALEYDERKTKWYPDFLENKNKEERRNVFDAKYKKWDYNNDDMHQLLSYLYLTGGDNCGAIFPVSEETENKFECIKLIPFSLFYGQKEVYCVKMPFIVPKTTGDFNSYYEEIEKNIVKWKEEFKKR